MWLETRSAQAQEPRLEALEVAVAAGSPPDDGRDG